jgi:hypothetical protein
MASDSDTVTEEGSSFVPLGAPRRPPTSEAGPSEATNLVAMFTDEEQKKIAETVIRDYDADVKSREPRMKRLKEYQGLYASVMKVKNWPFQNCANINLPILVYPLLQIQGRLYDMVVPADGKFLYARPTGTNDMARAAIAEQFGNAYMRTEMPEMEQGMDDTMHQVCCYGSAFRRTYWNSYEGRVCSDWIPIEDFVVAHSQRSQDPSMRDVPRYTMVQHLTYYDLEAYGAQGIYENFERVKAEDPKSNHDSSEFKQQLEKIDGSQASHETTTEDKPRMVLEQHRIWRMPKSGKHAAFDGRPHAVIITVDEMSQQVLRMVVREEPDPRDLKRFQKEQQAFDTHIQQQQTYVAELQAFGSVQESAMRMGTPLPPDFAPPMEPAPPPGIPTDETGSPTTPKPQRQREICFFTHYRAFPSEGFYGLGFGDFLAGLNKGANALLNQHIDGVTLTNAKVGFISRQMKSQRGPITVKPGELTEVDAPMGAVKDGIFYPETPKNDPTTMPLLELLIGSGDKMVASSDIMSGSTSGANRTAKEAQILVSQAMTQITVVARRIKSAFKHELDKIWRCWGVFLPEEDIVTIIGEDEQPMELAIGRSLFRPDAQVVPAADPRTKMERLEETMAVYMAVSQNPFLMALPPPNRDALMRAVTEDVLRAHGADRLIKLLPPPAPAQPPPPPAKPYWEEDAGFLTGQDSPTHPDDQDDEHIMNHEAMLNSPAGNVLDKTGRDMAERHVRAHVAQKIRKVGSQQAPMQPPMQPQPGPPMAPA